MIKKYVKKPIPVEAIRWTGENAEEIMQFTRDARLVSHDYGVIAELFIHTLEGDMHANVGDFIIKGIRGEVYPCDGNIFMESYEEYREE